MIVKSRTLKKILVIAFSFLIIISSSGFIVSIHYCPMSKKTTFSLNEANSCCSKKGKVNKCCKNTQIKIKKIEDDYASSEITKTSASELISFVLPYIEIFTFSNSTVKNTLSVNNHAPPDLPISRVIFFRSIRI
ncbi:hypothetical protein BH10BAC1_BH10BAC1_06990 [soil metagenome]